jgi:hypothetical protein
MVNRIVTATSSEYPKINLLITTVQCIHVRMERTEEIKNEMRNEKMYKKVKETLHPYFEALAQKRI